MATTYSDLMTLKRQLEANTGYQLSEGLTADNGRLHVTYATWTSTAAAVSDSIQLFVIPKNARVIRGYLGNGALGASTTLAVGTDVALVDAAGNALTAAGSANLLAAVSTAAAAHTQFAATRLLGAGGFTTAPTTVSATVGGATLTAGIACYAWVEYLYN